MYLPWTVTLTTDDGALIQQIDLVAEITPYRDAGTETGEAMIQDLYVDHRRTPLAPPALSRITGPLAVALTDALEADPAFHDRARDGLTADAAPRRPDRTQRRTAIDGSGVRFGPWQR
ncbi:hypothetical protein [Novispirillum itersonii]|uniref:Uncharacterized protein n=1 Tax=Novispirillum itersonii TaxID=189 RepID=A0A7X0DL28_NOVIT|nr:hypothetical protein [Novispirillum itersonii]MBB6208729.1 hypothetical protein [Novispirillum itersonii]